MYKGTKYIAVKLSQEDLDFIKEQANARHIPDTVYIRLLISEAKRVKERNEGCQ